MPQKSNANLGDRQHQSADRSKGPETKNLEDLSTFASDISRHEFESSNNGHRTRSLDDFATADNSPERDEPFDDKMELVDLSSRYTMGDPLGRGGMAEVYLATDTRLNRKVAIKRVLGDIVDNRTAVRRFLTEAQSIAALNHPHIVQVYDYGRDQEGPFLILEYVDGKSLLDRCHPGPLPLEQAVDIVCQLCEGLAKAHAAGIIHRDIKPANILMTRDGLPKLTDFGLARIETIDTGITRMGTVLGTLDFMSPEQRKNAALADARSDLWSLAATLYQLVTGDPPRVISLDAVPAPVRKILAQALKVDPDERFQTAQEFRKALLDLQQDRRTLGRQPDCTAVPRHADPHPKPSLQDGRSATIDRFSPMRRTGWMAGSALGISLMIVLAFVSYRNPDPASSAAEPLSATILDQVERRPSSSPSLPAPPPNHRSSDTPEIGEPNKAKTELRQLLGHTSAVRCASFSPDGLRVVSGSWDTTVRLWDIETGRELWRLDDHSEPVSCVAFSPDGRYVVSGSHDSTVRLWDTETGVELRRFKGHRASIFGVLFSVDGRRVFSASADTTIRLWDVETGEELQKFEGHEHIVRSVALSPDGHRLASGSQDNTIRLWDVETGRELMMIDQHPKWVRCVIFSPDGRLIASGSSDNTIRLWDAQTGNELQQLQGHMKWISSLAFSPDGRQIVSASGDASVRLWDVERGIELGRFSGHRTDVRSVSFSPNGQCIVSGGGDAIVRLWWAQTGQYSETFIGSGGAQTLYRSVSR